MSYQSLLILAWVLVFVVIILLLLLLFRKQLSLLGRKTKPGEKVKDLAPDQLAEYQNTLLERLELINVPSQSPDAVPLETVKQVAQVHAGEVWGSEISGGQPLQILDQAGEPAMYAVPFLIGGEQFPGAEALVKHFSSIRKLYLTQDHHSVGKVRGASIPDELLTEIKKFGTVFVSARKNDFPVTRVSHCLHPYFYRAEEALLQLGLSQAKLEHIRFVPPCHDFFEFNTGGKTDRLQVNLLISEEELRKNGEQYKSDVAAAAPSKEYKIARDQKIKQAWEIYLNYEDYRSRFYDQPSGGPPAPPPNPDGSVERRIRQWERIPPILWTWWCEPTAASMVFAYWDHYVPVPGIGTHVGYDRIVDYWMDHPSNDHNVPDVIDPIADGNNIDAANVLKGYNWSVTKVHGDSQNNYALGALIDHINANRPAVWQVLGPIDHAVCAFGYRLFIFVPTQYVIVYNTWDENVHEWLYDSYGGVLFDRVEVDQYVPGGKELYRYLFIRYPYGGETFHVGNWNEIRFAVHPLTDITRANIEYSLDGGQTWNFMVQIWAQPGWNSWWWKPTTPSDKARVRIKGLGSNMDYLGGDGSFKNFRII